MRQTKRKPLYLQLLEGDRFLVSQCMMRIAKDARHTEIELVAVYLVPALML